MAVQLSWRRRFAQIFAQIFAPRFSSLFQSSPVAWGGDRRGLRQGLLLLLLCVLLGVSSGLSGCQSLWSNSGLDLAAVPGHVHLTLWQGVNPPPNRAVLQKLVDRFNQTHPHITVESLYVGQGDQQLPKLLAAAVGNATPDLLWYAPVLTGQFVEWGVLRSLDQEWAHTPEIAELDPTLEASTLFEGKHWSVPFSTNNIGIYYRPSLFRAAGITQLPKTWAELRQVAKQLSRDTNGDGKLDQHGMVLPLGKGEWTVFTWLPFFWSGGGDLGAASGPVSPGLVSPGPVSPGLSPQVNTPAAIAALSLWQQLLTDGSAVLSGPERGYELDGLISGKVAMQLSGPWTLAQLQQSGVDFGVLPIPTGQVPATIVGGENLFLFKSTPEREQAAWQFAQYVLSESFQTEWAIGTGYLPVNLKSRQSAAYQAFRAQQPAVDVFLNQAQYGRSRPIAPGYNRLSEHLGRAIEAVLLQRSTPEQALSQAQARLDLIFKPT